MWGFQLWVNLPARDKMTAPRYQDIPPEKIPEAKLADGVQARVIAGVAGARSVRLPEFVRGAMETELATDELLTAVRIPRCSRAARFGFHKICRKTGEFAEAIGVAVQDPERQLTRLACSTSAGAPIVLDAGDLALGQASATGEVQARLVKAGLTGDAYDLMLHAVAVRRALLEALAS